MPAAVGGDPAVATVEYYDASSSTTGASKGQIALVVDANGVAHGYKYDKYGYLSQELEGLAQLSDRLSILPPFVHPATPVGGASPNTNNGIGQVTCFRYAGCSCCVLYNANGQQITCPIWTCPIDDDCGRLGSVASPCFRARQDCFSDPEYDVLGRLHSITRCAELGTSSMAAEYDELGRLSVLTKSAGEDYDTSEVEWSVQRTFTVDLYDAEDRPLQVTLHPDLSDDQTTEYTFNGSPGFDELGRLSTVTRDGMSATFTYDAAGRLTQVLYGNGTKVVREYDHADRMTLIEHRGPSDQVLFSIQYVWNLNNTLYSRTEYDATVSPAQTAVVSFQYDNRGRLIGEQRVVDGTNHVYDIAYDYDQLGNRLRKTDSVAQRRTCYIYDTDWDADANQWRTVPPMYYTPAWTIPDYNESRNNRLLEYCEFDISGPTPTLLRTVHYTYWRQTGHVSNITLKDEWLGGGEEPDDYSWWYDLALYYTTTGKVRHGLWGRWHVNEQGEAIEDSYEVQARRQFAYEGYHIARMRENERDPEWIGPGYPETEFWRDHFGGQIYADYQIDVGGAPGYPVTVTEQQSYLAGPGLAQQDADGANTRYRHGDLIDSSMVQTDSYGTAISAVSYTAFGEPVVAGTVGGELPLGTTRHGYAGGWGYESGHYQEPPPASNLPGFSDLLALYGPNAALAPVTLQHVGFRWYQPEIGRFVQRDPIGTEGGPNVYTYVLCRPLTLVDPLGLWTIHVGIGGDVVGGGGWIGGGVVIIIDGDGIRAGATGGIGLGIGGGASGGISAGGSNARNGAALGGWGWSWTCITPKLGGTVFTGPPGAGYWGGGVSVGPGVGGGVGTGPTGTVVTPPIPWPDLSGLGGPWRGGWICFVEGTNVLTPDGMREIQDLCPGDTIISAAGEDLLGRPTREVDRISATLVGSADSIVVIQLDQEKIECTPFHPFYVLGRGWTEAGKLAAGDLLVSADGEPVPVLDCMTKHLSHPINVYNISVEGCQTYFVGKMRVLVHNKSV
jgi:RHS repeat-associated protein